MIRYFPEKAYFPLVRGTMVRYFANFGLKNVRCG